MSLNIPPVCGQDWLSMKPVQGGRRCGSCQKVIHDFRKKGWAEIEAKQAEHGNALCGIYSDKQIAHWGHEPPPSACKRWAKSGVLWSMLALAVPAAVPAQTVIVKGVVTDGNNSPLEAATVIVDEKYGAYTDEWGKFQIKVPADWAGRDSARLMVRHIDFEDFVRYLDVLNVGENNVEVRMGEQAYEIVAFRVNPPTLGERIRHFFRRNRD